jgi:hypothetical protein
MTTYTGGRIHPLEPRAEDVRIEDVARGLAFTCRYRGQIKRYYSVAEHSVLVSRHVDPKYAREALMHDAPEAFLGDLIRPLKHQPEMAPFREADERLGLVIGDRFNLDPTETAARAVKEIDDRILRDEIAALSTCPENYLSSDSWLSALEPVGADVVGYSPERAEVLFLLRFAELFPEWGVPRVRAGDLEIL